MITKKLTELIFEHVKAEYPKEACGVICQKSRVKNTFLVAIFQITQQSILSFLQKIMRLLRIGVSQLR